MAKDERKTKARLIKELQDARKQIDTLSCSKSSNPRMADLVKHQLVLEQLKNEILISFANCSGSGIEKAVNSTLEKISRFVGASSGLLFIFSNNLETVTNTHEWWANPVDCQSILHQEIPFATFGWQREEILQLKTISLSTPADYPETTMGKLEWLEQRGFRSLILLPLQHQGALKAVLGLYGRAGEEITWPPGFIDLLNTVGNIIIYALERKRAEEELRESEEKFRMLVEDSPDFIYIADAEGKILYINRTYPQHKRKDVIGKNILEFSPPEQHDEIKKAIAKVFASNSCVQREAVSIAPDGREVYHKNRYLPLRQDGEDKTFIGVSTDITKRMRVEEKLKQQQALLHEIIEGANDAIFVKDLNGRILVANTADAAMAKKTPSEMTGELDSDLFPESVVELAHQKDLEVSRTGKHLSYEQDFPAVDGGISTYLVTKFPKRAHDGSIDGVIGIARDITERKLMEKALEQSEMNYRTTVDALHVGVVVHASDSRVLMSNPEASHILALTKEQMSGKAAIDPAWHFVYADSSEMKLVDYPVNQVIGTREPLERFIMGVKIPDRDQITWCSVSAIPILSAEGELEKIVINFIDITETRRLQTLESRAGRLEMAGTIAGQVAHDFNNLLAPILAYPEFIHDDLPHDHQGHAYLDAIEDAARKIADINQDLLTMGRRGHYSQEVMDLNRIVLQTIQEMDLQAQTVIIKYDLCKDLMRIKGGVAQIHRMLINLLINARDAIDSIGQIVVKTENYYADDTLIAYGRVPKGEYIKLTITDDGCGIPDDIIQKILDPFFSTKTSDRQRGSGLGLSVVDAVMKDHNGYLDLSSRVGHGTSFYLYFPVTREDINRVSTEKSIGGNESILVVDDDDIQRDVTSHLLLKLGYRPSVVASGLEAIEFLRQNPQDLIILDMVMPGGMDGAETYAEILKINPHQRAILLSGFSESHAVLSAQKSGAGVFVKKPVTGKILARAVRGELDRKKRKPVGEPV